ncbi:MAG: RnfABCDGE type electron transport complex subunit G [Nanoarchaeota archaeon]
MNDIIKLGLILMAIGLISSLALALTFEFTADKIKFQEDNKLKKSLKKALPDADHFEKYNNYYKAFKKEELIGRVMEVHTQGYSSLIKLLVGLDLDNKVIGISVTDQLETPGLGGNIAKDSFLGQFIGKDILSLKLSKHGGAIDGITGATISSQAVIDGIIETKEQCGCDSVTGASNTNNITSYENG